MGVARAGNLETVGQSNAQFSGGSLKFDSAKSQYLNRTPGSAGNRKTWTWSGWVKKNDTSSQQTLFSAGNSGTNRSNILFDSSVNGALRYFNYASSVNVNLISSQVFRDAAGWYHIVVAFDSTQATEANRLKFYVNGVQVTNFSTATYPSPNLDVVINNNLSHSVGRAEQVSPAEHLSGQISNLYFIDGQALDPSYFGYTDPLTNTWRPKKYTGTYGTNGFYLPLDGNTPIGQDLSGNNNNWTPVNFGGSNTLEKATGALPILNTDGGGKVARAGVRTDAFANNLVLALPLVGIKDDISNRINSGSTAKTITANGDTAASSAQSNFYGGSFAFDGTGDYLSIPDNADFAFGSGDFTIESWVYINNLSSTRTISGQNNSGGGGSSYGHFLEILSDGSVNAGGFEPGVNYINVTTPTGRVTTGKWHHIAMVRNGNNLILYVDGINQASLDITGKSFTDSSNLFAIGRPGEYNGYYMNGYIQDYRLYKGVAKYTQNFIPASTDPDILPDTPSGVAYSSNVALVPSTDGAVVTTGSGVQLTVANSTDFDIVGGDYSMELFAYAYSTGNIQSLITRGSYSANSGFGVHNVGNEVRLYYGQSEITTGSSLQTNRWHHIAITQSSGRQRIFVDGKLVGTATMSISNNNSNLDIGHSNTAWGANYPHLGFISNVRIIKGSIPTAYQTSSTSVGAQIFTPPTEILTTTSQGATSGDVKLLCCKSQTSATAFDVSPGSITATNAVATNFNPFTANINAVRGQESGYCTLNPLLGNYTATLSDGNLTATGGASNYNAAANTSVMLGKWYWEATSIAGGSSSNHLSGIVDLSAFTYGQPLDYSAYGYGYRNDAKKTNNNLASNYGSTYTVGDVIGVAFDGDAGTLTFYKNGISQGQAFSGISTTRSWTPGLFLRTSSDTISVNFGQKPFKFPPPAGFQPLALANTPRPTIVRPDQYVGVTTYSGTGSIRSVGGLPFKPDFVWIKGRVGTEGSGQHRLYDTIRGVTNAVYSNLTFAEESDPNCLTQFNADGFSVGSSGGVNDGSTTYVAWCWKAGGAIGVGRSFMINDVGYATTTAAGLTAGTIAPTGASINTKSGFSIITYTGKTGSQTVPHGLGKTPSFIIIKNRTDADDWAVYHTSLTNNNYMNLNSDTSQSSSVNMWNDTDPTTTVFSLGSASGSDAVNRVNNNGRNYVAYVWAEIPGFSKFGTYVCTSNSDGPTIITGFRPKIVILKCYDSTSNWAVYDSERNKSNPMTNTLGWNSSNAENTPDYGDIDFLSNGFKIRASAGAYINNTPDDFIWMAFAETPSFNLYGGQSNAR